MIVYFIGVGCWLGFDALLFFLLWLRPLQYLRPRDSRFRIEEIIDRDLSNAA